MRKPYQLLGWIKNSSYYSAPVGDRTHDLPPPYDTITEHNVRATVAFQSLHRHQVEPLQQTVTAVSASGQGLVRSAAAGVDTTGLEAELDLVGEKWRELNEKVSRCNTEDVQRLQTTDHGPQTTDHRPQTHGEWWTT